jgi:lipopolysaccharide transport system permease protein
VSARSVCFSAAFSPQHGSAAGWQLYDPESDFFLAEGEWRPLSSSAPTDWEVELPPEDGPYRLYVSPVDPSRGWHYARGGRFLVIDAVVENGAARLLQTRTTTLSALRWSRRLAAWKPLLFGPVRLAWHNRALVQSMVRRDVSARYRGSAGDLLWTFLNPLLLMAAYFFVFGLVLRARFPGDPSASGFVLYFLAGMMPWLAFSEAVGRSPTLLLEHRNFVKKILFPIETLPVQVTLTGLVTQMVATAIFLVGLLWIRGVLTPSALWFPLLLIPQILITLGLCWLLAALGAFLRDLAQIMGFVLTLWFFLTPICYPETSLPKAAWTFLRFNPLVHLVRAYRSVLLEGVAPELDKLVWLYAVGFALAWFGHAVFFKLRKSFADVL